MTELDTEMSTFLRGPSTVLVLTGRPALGESVTAAVDEHWFQSPVTSEEVREAEGVDHDTKISAHAVADCEAALDRLADDDSIGCVVVDDAVPDRPVDECVAAITDHDADMPVVVYAADGDERLASDATRAGAHAYLPVDGTETGTHGVDEKTETHGALLETIEKALRTYDRRYRAAAESGMLDTVFEDLEVPMYVKDREARHLKMADVQGAPGPRETIGKTDWELYSWEEESKIEALGDDRLVINAGEAIREREEMHGPPEAGRWLKTTKVPWRDGERTRGLVGISQDVSDEHRQIRDLKAQNRRLDDFASFVSHDLRNPLHVALSFLELTRETDQEHLDRVEEALQRMSELVDDLGELATSGGTAPAPVGGVEFGSFFDVVWTDLATAESTLDVQVPPDAVLYTNRLQLKPLFENLFKNAIDHAGEDVTVTVGALDELPAADGDGHRSSQSGFYVADDGPGIPEDDRETVLEEGYTTADRGTGTGLAIVSEVADTHGWDLRVGESESGGARFEFGNVLLVTDPEPLAGRGTTRSLTNSGDVGDVLNAGESTHDATANRWTLRAAGDNLLRNTNEFHFRWAEVHGPVRITARVAEFEGPADQSKAGVMVRDDTTEDATFGYVGRTDDGRTELLWRAADGEPTRRQYLGSGDRSFDWLRLERRGERLTAFVSADGEDWHAVDQRAVALDDPVCVGLAACSLMIGAYCEATFSNVDVTELDLA